MRRRRCLAGIYRLSATLLPLSLGCGGDGDPAAPVPTPRPVVTVSPAQAELFPGESVQFTAQVTGPGANPSAPISWASDRPDLVTVDSDGVARALAFGSARISATAQGVSDRGTVRVTQAPVVPAFPSAEGWGAMALSACRWDGVEIREVNQLGDSGAGSLRDAIQSSSGDRYTIVVFTVAGIIELDESIEVRSPCLYVAGQTAPGSGITIRAPDRTAFFLQGNQLEDVAIRYLRFRNGTDHPGTAGNGRGMIIGAGSNVIVDHSSFSWASHILLMIYHYDNGWTPPNRVTVQNTLLAEPFSGSPVCYSTKGDTHPDASGVPYWYRVEKITLHHNAAIHCSHRAPMIVSRDARAINNVVYNWHQGAMHTEGRKPWVDYIGNYFQTGPMTVIGLNYGREFSHTFLFNRPGGWTGEEPDDYVLIDSTRQTLDGHVGPGIYLEGNVGPSTEGDQWSMTSKYRNDERDGYPEINYESVEYGTAGLMPVEINGVPIRRNESLPSAPQPVTVEAAQSVWSRLIEVGDVGANRRLSCDGGWVDNQDAVDQRFLADARTGTGPTRTEIPDSEAAVGGYPAVESGSACPDADGDGMPDAFESRYGFDPSDPGDGERDADRDGYLNIEEYLNAANPLG